MKISDAAKQTVQSGVVPIVLSCYTVKHFDSEKTDILRSILSINSLELGVLTPAEYRFVARRTKQGDALVEKHIEKLMLHYNSIAKKFREFECITLPAFPRLLKENRLSHLLAAALQNNSHIPPDRICVELSADVLFENFDGVKSEVAKLRELGVRIAISEAGDDFCPLTRLSALKPDFVFADAVDASRIHPESEETANLVRYCKLAGAGIYAPLLADKALIAASKQLGFDGYPDRTPTAIGGAR